MADYENAYSNGYLKRDKGGKYEGVLTIEGIDLSPIVGVYFQDKGDEYLWLKRKRIIDYDISSGSYVPRNPKPFWECYLEKHGVGNKATYEGKFTFFHLRYKIVGVQDPVFKDEHRVNFFVDRLPGEEQTIINGIKERGV